MSTDRSASKQLIGYFYQFDKTILEILNQTNENSEITIEGIEDIDSLTTNTQVKYYTSKKIILESGEKSQDKEIGKAILLLLISYCSENKRTCLFGHFQSDICKAYSLTIHELNKYIVNSKGELNTEQITILDGLTDAIKNSFISSFSIETGLKYEDQKREAINKIKKEFSLNDSDGELYYNYALAKVTELACQTNINNRKISKKEFKGKINNKNLLYNKRFKEYTDISKYCKYIKRVYFSVKPKYERFFIIETAGDESIATLKQIVLRIKETFFSVTSGFIKLYPPYIFFSGLSSDKDKELKEALWNEGYIFQDGYPYKNADFKSNTLSEEFNIKKDFTIRFIDSFEGLQQVHDLVPRTKEIYHFYISEGYQRISNGTSQYIHININNITDVISIFNS